MPFSRPVVAADGHVYERQAIAQWLGQQSRSPLTGLPMDDTALTPAWHTMDRMRRGGAATLAPDLPRLQPPMPSPGGPDEGVHGALDRAGGGSAPHARLLQPSRPVDAARAQVDRHSLGTAERSDALLRLCRGAAWPAAVRAWAVEQLGLEGTPRAAWHLLLLLAHPPPPRRSEVRFWLLACLGAVAARPHPVAADPASVDEADAVLLAIALSELPRAAEVAREALEARLRVGPAARAEALRAMAAGLWPPR